MGAYTRQAPPQPSYGGYQQVSLHFREIWLLENELPDNIYRLLLQAKATMVLLLLLIMEAVPLHQVPIITTHIQLTLGQVLIVLCSPSQCSTKRLQPRKSCCTASTSYASTILW